MQELTQPPDNQEPSQSNSELPPLPDHLQALLEHVLAHEQLVGLKSIVLELGRFSLPYVMRHLVDKIKLSQQENDTRMAGELKEYAIELLGKVEFQVGIESASILSEVLDNPLEVWSIKKLIEDTLLTTKTYFIQSTEYIDQVLKALPLFRTATTAEQVLKYNQFLSEVFYSAQQIDVLSDQLSRFLSILEKLMSESQPLLVLQLVKNKPISVIANVVTLLLPISKNTGEDIVIENWQHLLSSNDEYTLRQIVSMLIKNNPGKNCLETIASQLKEVSNIELSILAAQYINQDKLDLAEILYTNCPQLKQDIRVTTALAEHTTNYDFVDHVDAWGSLSIAGYILEQVEAGNSHNALKFFRSISESLVENINQDIASNPLTATTLAVLSCILTAVKKFDSSLPLLKTQFAKVAAIVLQKVDCPQLISQILSTETISRFPIELLDDLFLLVERQSIKSIKGEIVKTLTDALSLKQVLTFFSRLSIEQLRENQEIHEYFLQLLTDTEHNTALSNQMAITKENVLIMVNLCKKFNLWEMGERLISKLNQSYTELPSEQLFGLETLSDYLIRGNVKDTTALLSQVAKETRNIPQTLWSALFTHVHKDLVIQLMQASFENHNTYPSRINYAFATLFPVLIKFDQVEILASFCNHISAQEVTTDEIQSFFTNCVAGAKTSEEKSILIDIIEQIAITSGWQVKVSIIDNLLVSNMPEKALICFQNHQDIPLQDRLSLFDRILESFNTVAPNEYWMEKMSQLITQFPINVHDLLVRKLTRIKAVGAINTLYDAKADLDSVNLNLSKLISSLDTYALSEQQRMQLLPILMQTNLVDFYFAILHIHPLSKNGVALKNACASARVQRLKDMCKECMPDTMLEILKLNLSWNRLLTIWDTKTYGSLNSIISNISYMSELEASRPGSVELLTNPNEYNIAIFSRYPVSLLQAMVDGLAGESLGNIITPGYIFTVNTTYDPSEFTHQTGQKLEQIGSASRTIGVTPIVVEFDGDQDFLRRLAALRRHTPAFKKAKFIIGITHGDNLGLTWGSRSEITAAQLRKPAVQSSTKDADANKRNYKRVIQLAKTIKKQIIAPSTEFLLLSCNQGNPDGTARLFSEIFGISVKSSEGAIAVESISANILPGKKIELSFKPIVGTPSNHVKGNRV